MDSTDVSFGLLSLYLPLPYRILTLLVLGVWLFGLNVHYLQLVRLDVPAVLRYNRTIGETPLHYSIYRIAIVLSSALGINILSFWILTGGSPEAVRDWQILPLLMFLVVPAVFLWPVGGWHQRGRKRFMRTLRRIMIGGIDSEVRFGDILLADALTSYAKVLGDLTTMVAMVFSRYSTTHPILDRAYGSAFAPFAVALPYACRFRQCLIEFSRAKEKGLPWMDQKPHLMNAAKYASAFPVILFSAMQVGYNAETAVISAERLYNLWLISTVFNSMYSFWWDVTRDWDLTLFTSARNSPEYPYGLRRDRHFVSTGFYYGAVVTDFFLRISWGLKLSSHYTLVEGHIFLMEVLEVFRRWMWVFFRVEKEWVITRGAHGLSLLGNAEEGGIMMQEYED